MNRRLLSALSVLLALAALLPFLNMLGEGTKGLFSGMLSKHNRICS